jgi:hypothetical protein
MLLARLVGARVPLSSRLAFGLIAALGTLLVAACQDPSGVGLGLIGEEGNDPNAAVVLPDSLWIAASDDVTGGFANGALPDQDRVLAGAVTDPVFGDVRADAYLDVQPPATVPSGFRDRTITSATLRLVRSSIYGDSTAMLDFALHEVAASWSPLNAKSDTTFAVGDLLATYDVPASSADSVVALALPASWVSENDELLRSDSVTTALDGFRLSLEEGAFGGAVLGFDALESRLRLTTEEDTVDYFLREVFTHVERGPAGPALPDRVYLRDGAGEALAFSFPFGAVGEVAVARAVFRLHVDHDVLDDGMLARSLPEELTLTAVTEDSLRLTLATASFDEDASAYSFTSTTLNQVIQDAVLGSDLFVRYEVTPARTPASVDVVPVVTGPAPGEGEAERRPRLVLTVIPATN